MAERQRFMKESNLILHVDTLFLLRKLIKPSFIDITSLNFFKLIISKFGIFRSWQIRFPILVFPQSRNLSVNNMSVLLSKKDNYLNRNYYFDVNFLSFISRVVETDQEESDKFLYGKAPFKYLAKSESLFTYPEIHLPKYRVDSVLKDQSILFNNQIITENRAEEDKDLYKIFPHIRTQFIFLKTSNMLSTTRLKKPSLFFSGTISKSFDFPYENHNKAYLSGKNKPWSDESKPLDEKRSKMVFSKVISFPSTHVSSNSDFRSQQSDIKTEKHRPILAFKQKTKRSNAYLDSDIFTPNLLYLNPLRAELDDLKKTVSGIKKKEAEGKSFTETMGSDKSHLSHKESDILDNKININLSSLTDQVYQMLERKIKVEKERRGL